MKKTNEEQADFKTDVYYDDKGNFNWDLFESDNPRKLKHNNKIKKHPGDNSQVYSTAPYAQELYELYNGSLKHIKEPKENSVVQGTVVLLTADVAIIDVNWREDAMIELRKENPEFLRYIQPGFPIEVLIEKVGDKSAKYSIQASYSKNIVSKKRDEIMSAIGEPVAYLAKVTELIHGGYFLDIEGIKCFMPGSLGGMNKLINFEELIGQSIYVVPINYSREKDYIVVSHREYLKSMVPQEIEKLEMGKEYEGFITGTSRHGIFVEFNQCLTGLISRNDIDPTKIDDFDNKKFKAGDNITFFAKEIIDDGKIVLTQRTIVPEISVWDDVENRYKVPSIVTGKVKKIVRYGVFVELEPKLVGLLHKSHLEENIELEVGQEIDVKIIRIDKDNKKVDFSM
jgi:small subunit ribosomal protein S1